MNKKAQAGGFAIILAIFIFIVAMSAINLLKPDITLLRTSSGINCSDASSISDGTKLICLGLDVVIPVMIVSVFLVAGGLIINKFIKARK